MQRDPDQDLCRHALARQVLEECDRRGLRVWQQFGAAYVARSARGRLVCAPKHWQRVVEALSYEIACLLDCDCGWGCTVERLPGVSVCYTDRRGGTACRQVLEPPLVPRRRQTHKAVADGAESLCA